MNIRERFSPENIERYMAADECRVFADGKYYTFEDININDTVVFGSDEDGELYDIPVKKH